MGVPKKRVGEDRCSEERGSKGVANSGRPHDKEARREGPGVIFPLVLS